MHILTFNFCCIPTACCFERGKHIAMKKGKKKMQMRSRGEDLRFIE